MNYKNLAKLYDELSSTTKRLKKTDILAKFLKEVSTDEKDILYLLTGRIYPANDERKIGIATQLIIKAISKATGISEKQVTLEWKKIGDLGEVAEKLTEKKKQTTLQSNVITIKKVLENFRKLPELEGKGTVGKKLFLITELLTSASPIEAKYLVRNLLGDLRVGVQENTIRDAMNLAFFKNEKETAEKIQHAIDKSNDIALVFEIAKRGAWEELDKVNLIVGKPIKAMLAQKAKTIADGFKQVGKPCAIEYKYDGFRLIIHKKNDEIILFTRRLENVTKQFPEVVGYIKKYVDAKTAILDSEAVGFDRKTKEYQPFQNVGQRIRRKYDIEKLQKELPVEVNVFDVLYYNGKSQLNKPFSERTELIKKIIKNQPYKIIHAKQIISDDEKEAEKFYKKALADNQEGVMMKNLSAIYYPGSRVGYMLKIKPDVRDLDLVITGAEYGTGKRKGWMSSFILSCKHDGEYLEVGKVGTGFKEKIDGVGSFDELTKQLNPYILKETGKNVTIKPHVIVAVSYQEIQISPNYKSGFALRFPRFVALRPDKHLSEITTLDEVKHEFETQKRNYKYG